MKPRPIQTTVTLATLGDLTFLSDHFCILWLQKRRHRVRKPQEICRSFMDASKRKLLNQNQRPPRFFWPLPASASVRDSRAFCWCLRSSLPHFHPTSHTQTSFSPAATPAPEKAAEMVGLKPVRETQKLPPEGSEVQKGSPQQDFPRTTTEGKLRKSVGAEKGLIKICRQKTE